MMDVARLMLCVWAGAATVSGTLSQDGVDLGSFTVVIGGGNGVSEASTAQIGQYQIAISALAPTPQVDTPIAADAYVATLTISLRNAIGS